MVDDDALDDDDFSLDFLALDFPPAEPFSVPEEKRRT